MEKMYLVKTWGNYLLIIFLKVQFYYLHFIAEIKHNVKSPYCGLPESLETEMQEEVVSLSVTLWDNYWNIYLK